MNDRTRNILEHMLEDAKDALQFVNEIGTVEDFTANRLYRKAVIMSILNIGELTKQLPEEFKSKHDTIPWRKIAGMRDIAAHGYHEMDDDIIWGTVKTSLPKLVYFLQEQLD